MENMGDSNSGPGAGGFMAGQRTVIDRATFETLIDALLDDSAEAVDLRLKAARELVDRAPSWWSGATAHGRVRELAEDTQ